jgi:hypothetical protein
MPRSTVIVEPHELCDFAEEHYKINNDLASSLTWWVTPECEVRTRTYDLADVRQEIIDEPEEEAAYPEFPVSPNQLLVDYMVANNLTSFTLTQ